MPERRHSARLILMTVVLRRSLLGALALMLAGFLTALPSLVEAHAALVRSDPAVNATLSTPPRQVSLWFTEALEGSLSSIQVLSSAGEDFAQGSLSVGPDPAQMSIQLRDLPPGIYSVVWTSFSSVDGHSLTGAYPFTVLNQDGTTPSGTAFAGSDTGSYSPPLSGSIARWLMLLAVAGVLGPGVLAVLGAGIPARWWAFIGAMLAATGVLVLGEFVFRQLDTTDVGTILGTRQGILHAGQAAAAVLTGALALLLSRSLAAKPDHAPLLQLGLMNQVASVIPLLIALVSHPAAGTGHGWLTLALAVHIWCSLAWPGALGALAWQCRAGTLTPETFQRFSLFALGSAALVLVLGVLVAVTQVPTLDGLESGYGEGLIIKTALFATAILLAAVNTLVLHRRLAARGALRGLLAEGAVLVAVLLVAGRISQLTPPATDATARAAAIGPGFERTLPLGDLNGTLAVVPNIVGSNQFVVALSNAAGGDIGEILRVRLRFTPSDPSLGRSEVILTPGDKAQFTAEGAFLSSAGSWTIEADVRRRGEDDVSATYQLQVEPPRAVNAGGTWSWPAEQFSLLQFAMASLGVAGLAVLAGRLRSQPSPRALRSVPAMFGIALAVWGFGFAFVAREDKPIDYASMQNPVEATTASITRGRELYLQSCASCHGQEGHGDGPAGATLNPKPLDLTIHVPLHSDGRLMEWISEGIARTAMPPWKERYSETDRWSIINFLRQLAK